MYVQRQIFFGIDLHSADHWRDFFLSFSLFFPVRSARKNSTNNRTDEEKKKMSQINVFLRSSFQITTVFFFASLFPKRSSTWQNSLVWWFSVQQLWPRVNRIRFHRRSKRPFFPLVYGLDTQGAQLTKDQLVALTRDHLGRTDPDALLNGFFPVWAMIQFLIACKWRTLSDTQGNDVCFFFRLFPHHRAA